MIVQSPEELVWRVWKVARWYPFYLSRKIPKNIDPVAVHEKMSAEYCSEISRVERQKLKRNNESSLKLFIYDHTYVLLATETGKPTRFNPKQFTHMKDQHLAIFGHEISLCSQFRKGGQKSYQTKVRMSRKMYETAIATFELEALNRKPTYLSKMFYTWFSTHGIQPYYGTLKQQRDILNRINKKRKKHHLPLVNDKCLRVRRRITSLGQSRTDSKKIVANQEKKSTKKTPVIRVRQRDRISTKDPDYLICVQAAKNLSGSWRDLVELLQSKGYVLTDGARRKIRRHFLGARSKRRIEIENADCTESQEEKENPFIVPERVIKKDTGKKLNERADREERRQRAIDDFSYCLNFAKKWKGTYRELINALNEQGYLFSKTAKQKLKNARKKKS